MVRWHRAAERVHQGPANALETQEETVTKDGVWQAGDGTGGIRHRSQGGRDQAEEGRASPRRSGRCARCAQPAQPCPREVEAGPVSQLRRGDRPAAHKPLVRTRKPHKHGSTLHMGVS